MNIQAIMKQAQKMQKDVMKEKEEINNTIFTETYSSVTVEVNGNKEIKSIKISSDMEFDKDDIEMLEDLTMAAVNEAIRKMEDISAEKMSKITGGLGGLF